MNMVWDIHGAAYYEQLWLTVPCSDDSTVFCFHFWRLSGLHVVPFKGCLGGSCILLCASEREMNFSVPKYCKKRLCKKTACSYWRGKISSPDNVTSCLQNTNILGISLKCHARFFMFSRAVSGLGWEGFLWEHRPWRMGLLWGCTSEIAGLFRKFQPPSLNMETSCLGMLSLCP